MTHWEKLKMTSINLDMYQIHICEDSITYKCNIPQTDL